MVGGVFKASVPVDACGGGYPWAPAEGKKMLERVRDATRRRDAAAALQGLGNAQWIPDMAGTDVMRVIREARRTHEKAFGVVIKHGACSPGTFGWLAHNAARHGWCKPGHPTPCVSGVGQMPDGTRMPIAIDAHMPRGRIVLIQPDALYRCEGKKSAEQKINGGGAELCASDAYGFVGMRREVKTGAKTSIAFDVNLPGQGQAPGPASRDCPPAEAPRARITARRRFGELSARVGGGIAKSFAELVAKGFPASQWAMEEGGGMAVAGARPSALPYPRPRLSPPLLAPSCPQPRTRQVARIVNFPCPCGTPGRARHHGARHGVTGVRRHCGVKPRKGLLVVA